MKLEEQVKQLVVKVVQELYAQSIDENIVKIDKTPSEFQGELTVVIFPFVKISRKNPEITAIPQQRYGAWKMLKKPRWSLVE